MNDSNQHQKPLGLNKRQCQRFIRFVGMGLALLSLSACDWVGFMLKEGALSLTGRSGGEAFTIEGKLPANFAIEVQAQYGPLEPKNCQTYSIGLGRDTTREHMESFKARFLSNPQNYQFKVPLTYSIGLCEMALSNVYFLIDGRYGELDWQQHGGHGGLRIVKTLPESAPGFTADGTLGIQGECTWLFQLSKARARLGQLSKNLNCKDAGAYVQRDQLPGKTIKLDIHLSPEERPYWRGTWIKHPEGWKPCLGKGPRDLMGYCENSPGVFKTFQMNGQTCTVYPNCTE